MKWTSIAAILLALSSTISFAATPTTTTKPAAKTDWRFDSPMMHDGKIHVFICGTGMPGMLNQDNRKPACIALLANNQFIMLDSGEGSIQTIPALQLPFFALSNIFITHLHSDHIGGIGQVLNETWLGRKHPIHIYGPFGINKVMKGLKKAYSDDVMFRSINRQGSRDPQLASAKATTITADQYNSMKTIYDQDGLSIQPFLVNHNPVFPALGYRLKYKDCTLVFSGDTKVFSGLKQGYQNADALISEAWSHPLSAKAIAAVEKDPNNPALTYFEETYHYHSDTLELAKLANEVGVKNLFLTHLIPSIPNTPKARDSFKQGMDQYYKAPIHVTADGDEIVLAPQANGKCEVTYVPTQQTPAQMQNERNEKFFEKS